MNSHSSDFLTPIRPASDSLAPTFPGRLDEVLFHTDATYVVSGGLSGVGLVTARWLAEGGAGHLVLLSRSGRLKDGDGAEWRQLVGTGAEVEALACDVAVESEVRQMVEQIRHGGKRRLRGVFHAAGVLADAALGQQKIELFKTVFGPGHLL